MSTDALTAMVKEQTPKKKSGFIKKKFMALNNS